MITASFVFLESGFIRDPIPAGQAGPTITAGHRIVNARFAPAPGGSQNAGRRAVRDKVRSPVTQGRFVLGPDGARSLASASRVACAVIFSPMAKGVVSLMSLQHRDPAGDGTS